MKANLLKLYDYNQWRYKKLFAVLEPHPDVLSKDYKLFFKSIFGTLNHLLFGDFLWHMRLLNQETLHVSYLKKDFNQEELCTYWQNDPQEFTNINFGEQHLKALEHMILQQNRVFYDQIQLMNENDLTSFFEYKTTSGELQKKIRQDIYLHLINHHTHHLGQVTAALTMDEKDIEYPSLDYVYFLDEYQLQQNI